MTDLRYNVIRCKHCQVWVGCFSAAARIRCQSCRQRFYTENRRVFMSVDTPQELQVILQALKERWGLKRVHTELLMTRLGSSK